jgi:hypothetical protein
MVLTCKREDAHNRKVGAVITHQTQKYIYIYETVRMRYKFAQIFPVEKQT